MKYLGLVKACAASADPTTLPFTVMRLPLAWCEKRPCPIPVMIAGYPSPNTAVSRTVATAAVRRSRRSWARISVQPFDDRAQEERGQDHQPRGEHDHADQQHRERRSVGTEGARRDRRDLLLRERAGDRERRHDRDVAAE